MELWVDAARQSYGLEAEPAFEPSDPKAVSVQADSDIQLQAAVPNSPAESSSSPTSVTPAVRSNHPNLPEIRFLTDGSIADTSPESIQLTGRDGSSRWIKLSRNRLNYEIRSQNQ